MDEFKQILGDSLVGLGFAKVSETYFGKFEGAVLYIVKFAEIKLELERYLKDNNVRNVIIFNLVTDGTRDAEPEEYCMQPVYTIDYAVNVEEKTVSYSPKQPGGLLNMDKIINESLSGKAPALQEMNVAYASIPLLTYIIMAANAAVYIYAELSGVDLLNLGALKRGLVLEGQYYRMITSVFLHLDLAHLALNMFTLYIMGTRVERYFGRDKFLAIYFVSGICGSVVMLTSSASSAGASGAIFGLSGAALAYTQKTRKPIDGLNAYTMLMFVAVNVVFGFLMPNIGNGAHIGGLVAGYVLGRALLEYF